MPRRLGTCETFRPGFQWLFLRDYCTVSVPPQQIRTPALIEKRADGYMLHEQHEVGVEGFSEVQSMPAASLQEAVRSFVKRTFDDHIDGVVVDWGR